MEYLIHFKDKEKITKEKRLKDIKESIEQKGFKINKFLKLL